MTDREDLCGRKLGEFVVRERIGSGGFGDVYRCEQPLLGRQAVIKVLHQRLRYNEVVLQRFLREAQLASRLDHPYAAHVYAFGIERDDGLFWIAMEMVQGTTLAHWLKERGPLPLDQLVPFFELVAEVVQTAHDRGIVHRDLKPSNVMVIERAGRLLPKLLDFGIAKLVDQAAAAEPLAPGLLDAAAALPLAPTQPSSRFSADAQSASGDASPSEATPVRSGMTPARVGTTPARSGTTPAHAGAAAARSGTTHVYAGPPPREPMPMPLPHASTPVTPSNSVSSGSESPLATTRTATSSLGAADEAPQRLTRVDATLGSPPYMSPEQWSDALRVGPSADLYALGVVAYEALTGRRPFEAATTAGYVELHRHAPVPSLGVGFSLALDRLFQRALAKQPEERFANALELAAAFRVASGLGEDAADLPRLDETVSEVWLAHAPQPLAESMAALEGARNAHQARDAAHELVRGLVRYLLAVAIATRAQVRDEDGDPELVDMMRTMRQRELGTEERVRLLRLLVRPLAGRRGAHPMPELVDLVTPHADDGADRLDGMLAVHAATDHTGSDEAVRGRLARMMPDLAHVLRRAVFVLDYALVVPRGEVMERWTGLRRQHRQVAALAPGLHRSAGDTVAPGFDAHPMLLDRRGRVCADLWPVLQVESPSEGAEPEVFVFDGRGRHGALLVAAPTGYERSDPAVWDWIAEHVMPEVEDAAAVDVEDDAPYLGLTTFSTGDAERFVGREREIDALLNRLRQRSLQIVVGASGVGKSSFVHAGVLASLPPGWRALTMRPGATPLAALASRMSAAGIGATAQHSSMVVESANPASAEPATAATDLRDLLEASPAAASALLTHAACDATIIVVIDQLEELFTLCTSPQERQRFAAVIAQLAMSADASVRVICTIRDDFLMQLEALSPLRPLLSPALVLLGNPARDTLVRILVEPARRAGYTFSDPDLAQDIVNAVPDRPGALALLSFTASRLWELRDRRFRQLTRGAYEAMGGVGGALGQHAEATFEALAAPEKKSVRDIFRLLVTAEGTRSVITLRQLRQRLAGQRAAGQLDRELDVPRTDAALDKLVAARLVATSDTEGEVSVEIIHEALISAWPRLQQWMREDADGARMRDQVRAAARRWHDDGRPRSQLWRDDALADLQRWLRQSGASALGELDVVFVDACRRQANRKRRWLVGFSVLAIVLTLGGFQLRALQNRVARGLAEAQVLQSYAEQGRHALLDGKYTDALMYIGAVDRSAADVPGASFMLARAAQPFLARRARLTTQAGRMWAARFSRDGKRIVTSDDRGARLWDAGTYQLLAVLPHDGPVYDISLTPDGESVVTAGRDGRIKVWRLDSGALVFALSAPPSGSGHFDTVAISPEGAWLAAMDYEGDHVHVWDVRSREVVADVRTTGAGNSSLSFSADGRWLAVSGGDDVQVLEARTWVSVLHIPGPRIRSLAFDPSGPRLATASALGDTSVWSIPSGERLHHLHETGAGINQLAYSPDGAFVATAGQDGSERVWNTRTGALQLDLVNHRGNVRSISFDAGSRRIASGGADGTVVISDIGVGIAVSVLEGPHGRVNVTQFDPDSQRVVGASWDGTAWVWDATTPYHRWSSRRVDSDCLTDPNVDGDQRFVIVTCRNHGAQIWDTARDMPLADLPFGTSDNDDVDAADPVVSVAGDRAAVAVGNTVAVYALPGGRLVRTITHGAAVSAIVFARAGRDLVSGASDGTLLITREGADSTPLSALPSGIVALALTSDHRLIASGVRMELRVYDIQHEVLLVQLEAPARLGALRLSADGRRMLGIPRLGVVAPPVLWSLDDYGVIARLDNSAGYVFSARFVRGDREVLTAGNDGSLALWNATTGQLRERFFGSDFYSLDAIIAPDGETIVAGGGDGILRFWNTASATLVWTLRAHRGGISGLHFDGGDLVTRGAGGELSRWNVSQFPPRSAIEQAIRCLPVRLDHGTGRPVEQRVCD